MQQLAGRWRSLFGIGLCSLGALGCGNEVAPPADKVEKGTEAISVESPTPPATTESPVASPSTTLTAAPVVVSTTDGPVAAVQAVLTGLEQGNAKAIWDFLPASYQTDVNGLIGEFATKMDPEIWTEAFGLIKKVSTVLEQKRDVILEMPTLQPVTASASPEEVKTLWDGLVALLKTIANSELADLEKLKSPDAEQFLAGTGTKILGQIKSLGAASPQNPFAKLSGIQVKLTSQEGEKATLTIQGPDDTEPETVEFVVVEGKWVPQQLATDWKKQVEESRQQLAAIDPETIATQKEAILGQMAAVNGTLDKLLATKTPEEFNEAVAPIAIQAFMMASQMNSAAAAPAVEDQIQVLIAGDLSNEQQEVLFDKLQKTLGEEVQSQFSASSSGGQTTIYLSPVKDIKAFAAKIDFAAVKKVDAENATLELELPQE